jgi:uncharacterized protein YlxP (DUF503 family)
VDRTHPRFRVSVAETDFHDLHQRAEITMAVVTNGEGEMENLMEEIRSLVDREHEAFLTRWDPQILEGVR